MITWFCRGCGDYERSWSGAEMRDLIAHHTSNCPEYRGLSFLTRKNND